MQDCCSPHRRNPRHYPAGARAQGSCRCPAGSSAPRSGAYSVLRLAGEAMKDTNDSWVDVVLGTIFAFGVLPAF
ncbi:MAG: hypothetical protein ACYTFX_09630, partial [Planctomycetota bacterium]